MLPQIAYMYPLGAFSSQPTRSGNLQCTVIPLSLSFLAPAAAPPDWASYPGGTASQTPPLLTQVLRCPPHPPPAPAPLFLAGKATKTGESLANLNDVSLPFTLLILVALRMVGWCQV